VVGISVTAAGAAAQQNRVARLEAETGGVGRHVGPRLVDHADHAERDAHLGDLDAAGPLAGAAHLAHGVGERGDVAQRVGHLRDPLRSQQQAVEERVGQALFAAALHVGLVGRQDLVLGRLQCVGHAVQHAVLRLRRQRAQFARGLLAVGGEGLDGHGFARFGGGRLRDGTGHGGTGVGLRIAKRVLYPTSGQVLRGDVRIVR
jgi:hypothetical protein